MTWANILTLARLFLAPVFLVFALSDHPTGVTIAVVIFAIAAASDWFDGYLARLYGEVTEQGEFLDPLADKVLTTSAFVVLTMLDIVPLWMVLLIVARDFGTTVMRSVAGDKGKHMSTSWNAKAKTFLQMVFIVYCLVLLWMTFNSSPALAQNASELLMSNWTWGAMLGITIITVYTAVEYVLMNRKLFAADD